MAVAGPLNPSKRVNYGQRVVHMGFVEHNTYHILSEIVQQKLIRIVPTHIHCSFCTWNAVGVP